MAGNIIDGKAIAAGIREEVRAESDWLAACDKRRPGLAVVLVGDDPASHVYVRNKRRACEECGFVSVSHDLPHSATQTELLSLVHHLNAGDAERGAERVRGARDPLPELGHERAGELVVSLPEGGERILLARRLADDRQQWLRRDAVASPGVD